MEELIHWDWQLFHLINGHWNHSVLDAILPFWREKTNWIPLYLLLVIYLIYRYRWQVLPYFIAVGMVAGLADYTSSQIIKKQIERPRPCREANLPETTRLLVGCGGGYSFTSSHATNHFAIAIFLFLGFGRLMGRWRMFLLIWAAMVAYAQVYVGVHYPLDVLGGAILGSLIGLIIWRCYQLLPASQRIQFDQYNSRLDPN